MPKTITGTFTTDGYLLAAGSQGAFNPVTVTGSIDIGSGTIPAALYGQGPGAWTIANLGTITGDAAYGIDLGGGGTVINGTSAFVSGHYGIRLTGNLGSVTNSGTITAYSAGTSVAASIAIGVLISGGGGVVNQTNGQISGQGWGVAINGGVGTVVNDGTIRGPSQDGVYLASGAVTNQSHGSISGAYGVDIKINGSVSNAGTVTGGTSANQFGVYLNGGTVTNQSGGDISGGWGIYIRGTGTLSNSASVTGISEGGAFLGAGSVTNHGSMTGVWGVVIQGGTGSVTNTGFLDGTTESGVYLTGGGVNNATGGLIEGVSGVVIKTAAGTVVNSGQIEATPTAGYSVYTAPGFANQVVFIPGAVFTGVVSGGNTVGASVVSTLELASGSSQGTLSGLGAQFIDFGQVVIDSGASWLLSGVNSLAAGATLLDQGSLTLNGAVLFDGAASTISGTSGASAGLAVSGGGFWNGSAPLVVGASGDGSLTVSNNGSVSALASATQAAITVGSGATGSVEVSGPGSLLRAVGQLTIGQSGDGQVLVDTKGTISSGGDSNEPIEGVDIAEAADSEGAATVIGIGSFLTNTGQFIVGDAGLGSLSIQAGATVITTPGTVAGVPGLIIGNTAGASGSAVNVSGAGSELTVTGLLDAGVSGSGALSISNGATVTAGSLDAANAASAVANINVTDATFAVTGSATVADDGTGVLSVLSGGTFAAASLTIGSQGDASGAVVVSGVGSVVNLSGELNVGTALGTGDLTIGPGAVVNANVVNLRGQVVLEGGELDPTVNLINQGETAGGSGTIEAGDIVDQGVIQASGSLVVSGTVLGGGTLSIDGTMQGSSPSGVLQVNGGGTLELTGPVLNAATTTFQDNLTQSNTYTVTNSVVDVSFLGLPGGPSGMLRLDDIKDFAGTIDSLPRFDEIVIVGGTLDGTASFNGTTLVVPDSGPNAGSGGLDQIDFVNPFLFNVIQGHGEVFNGNGGITITVDCFVAGTGIETEGGRVAVEALRAGDRVRTHRGDSRQIIWIGQRKIDCREHPVPGSVRPIRVSAAAFGPARPSRDLWLSPDHAVYIEGVLIPIQYLINDRTIRQIEVPEVVYYHVELAEHDVILAEGLAVESYLDTGDRANFSNGGGPVRLFPDFSARMWEMAGCAPLIRTGLVLERVKDMLTRRASTVSLPLGARPPSINNRYTYY